MKNYFYPFLIASLGLNILSHYQTLPLIFIVLNFIVLGWFFFNKIQSTNFQLKKTFQYPWLKHLFTLSFLAILISYYGFHFTQDIATTLLVSMLCLKLLEISHRESHRHIIVIIYLQFFSLVVSFLSSQEFFLVIYNLLVFLLVLFVLLLYSSQSQSPSTIQSKSVMQSKSVTQSNFSPVKPQLAIQLKYLRKIMLFTLPLAVFMFLFFPRIPGPLWTLPSLSQQSVTGLSDSMYPGSVNKLSQSSELVFTVKFEDELPSSDQLYWRGPVLAKTDGFLWEPQHKEKQSQRHRFINRPMPRTMKVDYLGEPIKYEINLEPQRQKWLFTLDMPYSLNSQMLKEPYLSDDMQYLVNYNIRQLVQYKALSYRDYYLKSIKQDIQNSLQYPHPSNPKTFAMGQQLAKLSNPEIIIQSALDYYIKEEFFYTLKPDLMLENPSDQFLFDNRRGFCEHFASSFVLLMRAAQVPARVVTGYQGMAYNKVGDYYRITQANAHAWAEVWLDETGWTRIDPTAVIPQHRIENDIFERQGDNLAFFNLNYSDLARLQQNFSGSSLQNAYRQLQQSLHYMNYRWNQWVISYDAKKQSSLLNWLGLNNLTQVLWIAITVFCIALLIVIYYFNQSSIKPIDPILKIYKQFIDKLRGKGLNCSLAEPPELIKQRSIIFFPDNKKELENIFTLFIKLRYSNSFHADEIKQLKNLVRHLKASL